MELKVGRKGKLTMPDSMLAYLGVKRGGKIRYQLAADGSMLLRGANGAYAQIRASGGERKDPENPSTDK